MCHKVVFGDAAMLHLEMGSTFVIKGLIFCLCSIYKLVAGKHSSLINDAQCWRFLCSTLLEVHCTKLSEGLDTDNAGHSSVAAHAFPPLAVLHRTAESLVLLLQWLHNVAWWREYLINDDRGTASRAAQLRWCTSFRFVCAKLLYSCCSWSQFLSDILHFCKPWFGCFSFSSLLCSCWFHFNQPPPPNPNHVSLEARQLLLIIQSCLGNTHTSTWFNVSLADRSCEQLNGPRGHLSSINHSEKSSKPSWIVLLHFEVAHPAIFVL